MADREDLRVSEQESIKLGLSMVHIFTNDVDILSRKILLVHRDLLVSRSNYCKNILAANGPKAQISFPGNASEHLRFKYLNRYVQYLYTGKLIARSEPTCDDEHLAQVEKDNGMTVCDDCWKENAQNGYELLINLFLLGTELEDDNFCDAVINAFMAQSEEVNDNEVWEAPDVQRVRLIYEKTERGSRLRKLVVDLYAFSGDILDEGPGWWPNEFLYELSKAALKDVEGTIDKPWPEGVSCCDYHQHVRGAKCGSKKRKREDDGAGRGVVEEEGGLVALSFSDD